MKKIIFILFALAVTTMSCNKILDVKPTASVAADDAIKDKEVWNMPCLALTTLFRLPAFIAGTL